MIEAETKAGYEVEVADKLQRLARGICSGSCKSMEDYKYKCGQFHAWKSSVEVLDKVDRKTQQDEEINNLDEEEK